MSKQKLLAWSSVGVMVVLIAFLALPFAEGAGGAGGPIGAGWGRGHGFGPPEFVKNRFMGRIGRMMVLKSNLDVTPDQRIQLMGIAKKHRPEMAPAVRTVTSNMEKLRDAVIADSPDEKAIRTQAAELGKAIGDAAVLASKGIHDAKGIMTADQLELIKKFISEEDQARSKFLDRLNAL